MSEHLFNVVAPQPPTCIPAAYLLSLRLHCICASLSSLKSIDFEAIYLPHLVEAEGVHRGSLLHRHAVLGQRQQHRDRAKGEGVVSTVATRLWSV